MNQITLFCFPYAGGSASMIYTKWKQYLDQEIVLYPVELAGRGRRWNEAYYHSLEEAVDDVYNQIKPFLNKPFAFYGHSMGSLLVHELSYKIKLLDGLDPVHLFVSGRKAPQCLGNHTLKHLLSDEQFTKEIQKLGGTPEELMNKNEFFEFFIPILKADYKIIEEFEYSSSNFRLDCEITVLNGRNDNILEEELEAWAKHSNGGCQIIQFDGGHFFINDHIESIVKIINKEIKSRIGLS